MATAAAEQRHASAGLAQELSSLQPPDLLRTMAGRREAGGTKPGHVGHGRTGITGLGDHARWPPSGADR